MPSDHFLESSFPREKSELGHVEQQNAPVQARRSRRSIGALTLACLAVVSLTLFTWSHAWSTPAENVLIELDSKIDTFPAIDAKLAKLASRAVGDRYLLGVGKADVTG